MNGQKLLREEPFVAINLRLARELGLEAAAVLQQLHFRLSLGRSDTAGRWIVAASEGRNWLCWSSEGRASDLPLGSTEHPSGESAFRRVIALLAQHGLIDVKQVQKARWNRANFFAINYQAFDEKFQRVEPLISANRSEKTNDTNALVSGSSIRPKLPTLVAKEKELKEERELDQFRPERNDSSLWTILSAFISKRVGDDPVRDRKKCALVERICTQNGIDLPALKEIADDPRIQFSGQLLRRVEEVVAERRARHQLAHQQVIAHHTAAQLEANSAEQQQREHAAQATLRMLGDEALVALANQTAAAAPPSMQRRVAAHILNREIGAMPFRAFIVKTISRQAVSRSPPADLLPN